MNNGAGELLKIGGEVGCEVGGVDGSDVDCGTMWNGGGYFGGVVI